MRCKIVQKNLSAYLDKQLDTEEYGQIERHLAMCPSCLQKKEELQELIASVSELSVPAILPQQWEKIRIKLFESINGLIPKRRLFRIPKWTFAPAGAFIFALLIYLAVGVVPFRSQQLEPMSIDVCLQEHSILNSKQIFPIGIMPEIAITDTLQAIQKEVSDEQLSDLDPFVEIYYGIN